MIRNYFKIAWRNLSKNKLQTFINVVGLTVGTVCCLLIFMFVFEQIDYDAHHKNPESIYRVRTIIERDGIDSYNTAAASPPIAFAMKNDFPEVEEACRVIMLDQFNSSLLRVNNDQEGYYESRAYMADPEFFSIFSYSFVEGNPRTALTEPNTIVLSSSLSKKLFGDKKARNQILLLGSGSEKQTLTVTGVFDDTFGKSHLNPNYILSINSSGLGEFVRTFQNYATNNFVYSYVRLVSGTDSEKLQGKLPEFMSTRGKSDLSNAGMDNKRLYLQNITDIHLYSKDIGHQISPVSSIEYLYFLLILAFFIQLVACINFINLSTAQANKRAKEIGVRKVVGADKASLIRQFLGESLLLTFLVILLSIPITLLALPYVNGFTQGTLGLTNLFNIKILGLLLGLGILTGLISGIYPAIYLSSIKPVQILKGVTSTLHGKGGLRKALVVFQFVVSIGLITTVIIITEQFKYTQHKDLGFEKNNLLAVRMENMGEKSSFDALKSNFLAISGVSEIAASKYAPSDWVLNDMGLYLPGGSPQENTVVKNNGVSEGYFKTMKIDLLQGRGLKKEDENQIVVNEAFLKAMNLMENDVLGSKILQTYGERTQEFEIVGVVRDYHFASLKEAIQPLMLYNTSHLKWLFLRIETANFQQMLPRLEQSWKSVVQNVPFSYSFVDQEVENLYMEEKRLGKISMLLTSIAILISCLGLFGLMSYIAEQKKREIGIRKVLGASITSVVKLLTVDFVILVLIAFVIASPIAYYFLQNWLQNFTYKIEIRWWMFAISGGMALLITVSTIGFQSIKSAMINPIKSLRTE